MTELAGKHATDRLVLIVDGPGNRRCGKHKNAEDEFYDRIHDVEAANMNTILKLISAYSGGYGCSHSTL